MSGQKAPMNLWLVTAKWVFANVYGWALGLCLGTLLAFTAGQFNFINDDRVFIVIALLSAGLACGFTQWLMIRDILPRAQNWILGTLAGYVLALLIPPLFNLAGISIIGSKGDALLLAMMGAAIGVPQWWLLRTEYRGTGLWILATGIGFLAFLWLFKNPASSDTGFIVTATILGGFAAVLTGVVLAWIVRQPRIELS